MAEQTVRVPEVVQLVWDAARGKKLETLAALLRDRVTELQPFLDSQDATTEFLDTALTSCCRADFPAGVELLVKAGCGVNAPCKEGRTPLFVAAAEGFDECMKVLLSHGASVDLARNDGSSPLLMASQNGHDGAISLLLSHGASVDLASKDGSSPLHFASLNGHDGAISLLLSHGASVDWASKDGWSPLHLASQNGHDGAISLLLSHGASVDLANKDGWSPLHFASQNGHDGAISLLLSHGADAALVNPKSALDYAKENGHQKVVALLEKHNSQLAVGGTFALKCAAVRSDVARVKTLLSDDANKSRKDHNANDEYHGHTAAMLAASLGRKEVLSALLDSGCGVDEFPDSTTTDSSNKFHRYRRPIVCAAAGGHIECVKLLLEKKANCLTPTMVFGETPLSVAAAHGHAAVVKHLLALPEVAATASKRDSHGKTPLALCLASTGRRDLGLVQELLLLDLPCNANDGSPKVSHGDSWTLVLESASRLVSAADCLTLVQAVFLANPRFIKELAYAVDSFGRVAVNITHSKVRDWINAQILFCGRYELNEGPPVHRSATAVVVIATDHGLVSDYQRVFDTVLAANPAAYRSSAAADGGLTVEGFNHARCILHARYSSSSFSFSASTDAAGPSVSSAQDHDYEQFKLWDRNNSGSLSLDEYLAYCQYAHGKSRSVVLKCMRNEDQWQREVDVRSKSKLNGEFVISPLTDVPAADVFAEQVKGLVLSDGSSLEAYKYGLVMPAADRSLKEINEKERPDLQHIKTLTSELGHALKHCHDQGIVHADVKMLNVLRLQGRIRLIDMDASCVYSPDDSEGSDYAGCKYSSGVLPPEMFYQLKPGEEAQYRDYWGSGSLLLEDAELWKKIEPRKVASGRSLKAVVVKTFRTRTVPDEVKGGTYEEAVLEGLPFASELVRASPTLDVGGSLFDVDDRDDDLKTPQAMASMVSLTDAWLDAKIDAAAIVGNEAPLVKDLLTKLLRVRPADRLQTMDAVLAHPFFRGGVGVGGSIGGNAEVMAELGKMREEQRKQTKMLDAITESTLKLEHMSSKMATQLHKTERVLLNAVVEGVDVTCPSCTVIVNSPFPPCNTDELEDAQKADDAKLIEEANKRVTFMGKLMALKNKAGEVAESLKDKKDAYLKALGVTDAMGTCYYLYLVDESTMKPVVPCCPHLKNRNKSMPLGHCEECNYPVRMSFKDSDWETTHKMLVTAIPLMQLTLKAAKVYNMASGLVNMMGYPVPTIPAEYIGQADAAVGTLSSESSIADYTALNERLGNASKAPAGSNVEDEAKAVRGAALEELRKLLTTHGIGVDGNYAGLQRVAVTSSGKVIWTTQEQVQLIEADGKGEVLDGPDSVEALLKEKEIVIAKLMRRLELRDSVSP